MKTAVGAIIAFGLSRKMEVISEILIFDNTLIYSIVTLKGSRGAVIRAFRYTDNKYKLI